MQNKILKKESLSLRIIFTLGFVILVRLLYLVPLPGINICALRGFYQDNIIAGGGNWLDFFAILHVGKLRYLSLFNLGIMPFINACIIVQVIGFLIPGLDRIFFYHQNGRRKMFLATLGTMLGLCLVNAYALSLDVELLNNVSGLDFFLIKSQWFKILTLFSVPAATCLLLLLARAIDRFGVGNGIGVIFASELLVRFILAIDQVFIFYGRGRINTAELAWFFGIAAMFILVAELITRYKRKINLAASKDHRFTITVESYWTGIWPLVFAEILLSSLGISLDISSLLFVCGVIAFFSLFYMKIVYQPRRFYEAILACECRSCPDNQKSIEDFLAHAAQKTVFFSTLLFGFIYYLPLLMPFLLNVSFLSAGVFGVFGIIVFTGIFQNMYQQIKFFRRIKSGAHAQWDLVGVVPDLTAAQVRRSCLESAQIEALIHPSHFIWGLPIRTSASAYSVYVPSENIDQAKALLLEADNNWRAKAI